MTALSVSCGLQSHSQRCRSTCYAQWRSCSHITPALATAYSLLLQHPCLEASPGAVSSRRSSSSSSSSNATCYGVVLSHQPQLQQTQHTVRTALGRSLSTHYNLPLSSTAGIAFQRHAITGFLAKATDSTGSASHVDATHVPHMSSSALPSVCDSPALKDTAEAEAALSRLHDAMQRLPRLAAAASAQPGSSSSRSPGLDQDLHHTHQPVRPSISHTAMQQAQEQLTPGRQQRLLSWRSRRTGPPPINPSQQQPLAVSQSVVEQQSLETSLLGQPEPQACEEQLQPLRVAHAPPLEPSIVDGKPYVTSPVSIVAATTLTKRLAGSISAAFLVHTHQLMFAVGPHALATAVKALATARRMLAEDNAGQPVNVLMQPTLRGGRTPRQQSYALDIMRVGQLPMQPGVTGRQQLDGQLAGADARLVHITSTSNEVAAAHNLVENMPTRGQTVMRVMGPYATETAVLAVALARPLMQARWGQDLAVLVMWNDHKAHKSRQTGLLLSVFRCEMGSFPPRVLLQPPSKRIIRRMQHGQRRRHQLQHRQELEQQQ